MFLQLFKSNQPVVIFIVPVIVILAWLPGFTDQDIATFPFDRFAVSFYKPVTSFCISDVVFSKIIALVLYFFIGILLVRLNTRYFFIPERTQLPGVVYLIIISGLVVFQRCTPVLFSSLILLLAIHRIFASFKYDGIAYHYFDAALMISLSSLIYFNALFFIIFIWLGEYLFRPPNWREWVFTIVGFVLPYLFLFAYYYYFDKDINGLLINFHNNIFTQNTVNERISEVSILLIVLAVVFILTSFFMINKYDTKKVHARKFFLYFFWVFILTLALCFIVPSFGLESLIILAIPLAFLISHYFVFARLNFFTQLIFSLLMLATFYTAYQSEIIALFK